MKNLIIISLFTGLLFGCVGTVQKADQDFSKINDAPKTAVIFDGITSAVAISDSRVEVFYYPAKGGSGKYTYDIIIGNAPFPISVPSDVMQPDYRGLLKTTVTGLDRLTTYQIKVEVRDTETNVQSNSQVIKSVSTFGNQVADFNGITGLFNTPGQDGKDTIKVRWTPARSSGGLTKAEWDPKSYEIVLVDSERLTPNDMDVDDLGPADGRWVYGLNHDDSINEYLVRGLPSETKFYVRIRAIHYNSIEDVYDPKKRGERNTNYMSIATLSGDLADLNFQTESFAVTLAPGEQGLNALKTQWTAATGVFDHYRLYYSLENGGAAGGTLPDKCLSPLLSDPTETVWCKKVDFMSTTAPITGLKPYTSYDVVLVLCQTTACRAHERIVSSPKIGIMTDPSSPAFNGLVEVVAANKMEELGNLYLKFDPPNFTNGYFDGLVLKMRRTLDGSDTPVEITTLSSASKPEFHDNYNFLVNNQIVVKGVDYLSDAPYCFTLYPFKWDTDGLTKREFENDIWKCSLPKPEAPTAEQFPGLGTGFAQENSITLFWEPPSTGIFSHYELFYRKQSGELFNWGDAIAQAGNAFNYTNYGRVKIDNDQVNFSLHNFTNGVYKFGMVTYYTYVTDGGAVVIRSETNPNVLTCTVNDADPDQINCL